MSIESSRELAREQVRDFLGIGPDAAELFELAAEAFGDARAHRCRELAGGARLTRRSAACASVAELIVASRHLGTSWWQEERDHMDALGRWQFEGTPQALLDRGRGPADVLSVGSSLGTLANWACDDVADAEWGRPVDFVDLNDSRPDDRVRIPEDAGIGDRLTASYDPGCRVWLEVVERDSGDQALEDLGRRRGRLGTVLLGEDRCCDAADAGWAWGMATNGAPVRLPGETPGDQSDPFS